MYKAEPLGNIKNIIFDFDGVIADSFEIFKEALQEVLNRPNDFSAKEEDELRSLKTLEVMQRLGVKKWQLPIGVIKGRRGLEKRKDRVNVFEDMPETLRKLKSDNYKLFILTSSNEKSVNSLLSRYDLGDTMTHIYSSASLLGKSKNLKKIIRREKLILDQCVYVGDETRDIDAAKQIGMKSIAVSWGYNSLIALKSVHPDRIVKKPSDLFKAI
jgi:phosphoglycolate phosphatase